MLRLIGIVGFQSNFLCSSAQSVFVTPNFIFCRLICKKIVNVSFLNQLNRLTQGQCLNLIIFVVLVLVLL